MTVPRWARIVFFAGFPLAFAAGVALEMTNQARLAAQLPRADTNRDRAIAEARRFLAGFGLDTAGWRALCSAGVDKTLFEYLHSQHGSLPPDAALDLLPASVKVELRAPDQRRRALVVLSLENKVIGYDLLPARLTSTDSDPGDAEAVRIAQAAVESDPELAGIFGSHRAEVVTLERSSAAVTRRFVWHAPLRGRREAELECALSLRNTRILERARKATIDKAWAARELSRSKVIELLGYAYVIFMFVVAMYSIGSYARRASQKEVSHARTLWMALWFALLFFGVQFTGRDEMFLQASNPGVAPPAFFIWGIVLLMVALAAVLVGVAYGSGEGDVREAYPGKLTSLDALFLGRIFSSNVGGSIVVGVAFAGWLLLLRASVLQFAPVRASSSQLDTIKLAFLHTPWLSALLTQPAATIVFAVAGLLQPLAFLHRTVKRPRLRGPLLVLCSLFALSSTGLFQGSFAAFAAAAIVSLGGLLAPFFLYDFLAAVTSLVALDTAASLSHLVVLLPSWTGMTTGLAVLAALSVAVSLLSWRRGRLYREDEVRPEYARHIVERMELKAELAAAREAQLRLLPQRPPVVRGLSISAFCLPARDVGGDFYDFFPLGDQRLGVFLAEGAGQGLASALAIALAKGYLMHAARPDRSPVEVVERLQATLGTVLSARETKANLVYAVIDSQAGTLAYARTGSYPRILVSHAEGGAQLESESVTGNGVDAIHSGAARLDHGSSIVIFTDGLARRLSRHSPLSEEEWVHRLAERGAGDAVALGNQLLGNLGASAGAPADIEDDLTAVVVCCARSGAEAIEGAA